MDIILSVVGFIAGIAIILYGANFLVRGASALARKFKISELIIGLTIVALGTSLPELVISVGSAIKGSSGIALGNVVGSNIFNAMFILGITALITPIRFNGRMLSRELPFNLLASLVLILVAGSMVIGGEEGGFISQYSLFLTMIAIVKRLSYHSPFGKLLYL